MTRAIVRYDAETVESLIRSVRGQRVLLDADLARIYGVPTFRLNEAVKRNGARFPLDFAFQLEPKEVTNLISQNAISSSGWGGRRKRPWVFTEHGALMAANILRSPRAVAMSVFVVRAFVRMRRMLVDQHDLARKLAELEKRLSARLDVHEVAITDVLQQIMQLMNPPAGPEPPQKRIGFRVQEKRGSYRTRRRASS